MASVITDLAACQAKLGDNLPLKETVKETDAGKAFSLAPTSKNIFVRVPHYTPRI